MQIFWVFFLLFNILDSWKNDLDEKFGVAVTTKR